MNIAGARAYSAAHSGVQFAAMLNGELVIDETQNGAARAPFDVESVSKSLTALALYRLVKDGALSLDGLVRHQVPQWVRPPFAQRAKRYTTYRQLLSLTSGLKPGGIGQPPPYDVAVSTEYDMPAYRVADHRYGAAAHSVMGFVLARLGHSPAAFLASVLAPMGAAVDHWQMIAGTSQPHLGGGAFMRAADLLKIGEWMRTNVPSDPLLAQLVTNHCARADDPLYGIGWWLCLDMDRAKPVPFGGYMAAGWNNQRLIVLPALGLVVARLGGASSAWNDAAFVAALTQES